VLCQVQGFSNAQAASILGVGTRALESLLARARRALREHLDAALDADPRPGDDST
jgi:DNA-directed RNA polymerase specialized sigma24 family protein